MAASEVENVLPRFNAGVMLVLGVIVGMISYLLFFYAKASPTGVVTAEYIGITGPSVGYTRTVTKAYDSSTKTAEFTYDWYVKANTAVTVGSYFKNTGLASVNVATRAIRTSPTVTSSSCATSVASNIISTKTGIAIPALSSVFVNFGSFTAQTSDTGVATCVVLDTANTVGGSVKDLSFTPTASPPTFVGLADAFGSQAGSFGSSDFNYNQETCTFANDIGSWRGVNTGMKLTCSFTPKTPGPGVCDINQSATNVNPSGDIECPTGVTYFGPSRFIGTAEAAPTKKQCEDGLDNEGDGFIDFNGGTIVNPDGSSVGVGPDPGCKNSTDNQEKDPGTPVK